MWRGSMELQASQHMSSAKNILQKLEFNTVFWQFCLGLDWQWMPANPHLKWDKEKQSLSEWVGEMSTESHMWWERELGERGSDKERKRSERERERESDEKKLFLLYTTLSLRQTSCCSPHSGWLWQDTVCAALPLCVIDEPHFAN